MLLCGGYGPHSALDSAGPQAGRIESLWWIFFWVCAVVYALVLVFLFLPLFRSDNTERETARASTQSDPSLDVPDVKPDPDAERRKSNVVGVAVGLTVLTLFGLLLGDILTGRKIHANPGPDTLTIKLTGHQWWWEAQYSDVVPSNIVTTANEIHIPVGRPVKFELNSNDVIHSFWVPSLHGKKDLVPGHPVSTWLQSDREGEFWGQCAEFCGHQHANMRMVIVAEAPDKFAQWLEASRKSAGEPVYPQQARGQQVFMGGTCVMCHSIQGTPAGGRVGPDLTHVASRRILAAGAIPNTPGHMAGWIIDPQKIKPGTHMPQNNIAPVDLRALLEFLESLK